MNEELRIKNEDFCLHTGTCHNRFFILHSPLLILFVLYYLRHEFGFADYLFAYEDVAFHG